MKLCCFVVFYVTMLGPAKRLACRRRYIQSQPNRTQRKTNCTALGRLDHQALQVQSAPPPQQSVTALPQQSTTGAQQLLAMAVVPNANANITAMRIAKAFFKFILQNLFSKIF